MVQSDSEDSRSPSPLQRPPAEEEATGASGGRRSRSASPQQNELGKRRSTSKAGSRSRSRSPVASRRSTSRPRSRSRSPRRSRSRSRRRSPSRSRSRSRDRRRYSRSRSRSRDRGRRAPTPDDEDDGYRLHVTDLDSYAAKRDLEKIFGKYGPLKEIWMARSTPCFAFVVYRYKDDAEEACKMADGAEVLNRRIKVTFARPRTRGRGRRGFDSDVRCYQCGGRGHFSRDCPDNNRGYKRPSSPRRDRHSSGDR